MSLDEWETRAFGGFCHDLCDTGIPPNNTSASFLTLTEVFRGQHCSSVKCLECEREYPKHDPFEQLQAYQSE